MFYIFVKNYNIMKNIHILPTDKPSRLFITDGKLFNYHKPQQGDGVKIINQNIYITNSEEIKQKELCYCISNNCIVRFSNFGDNQKNYKRIILTTDQDLIKEGVQSIDDEFLEWFVKNPSCESVGVESGLFFYADGEDRRYKIIIPKEEICSFCDGTGQVVSSTTLSRFKTCDCKILPKEELSTKLHIGEVVDESYPKEFKQEPLEEAAIINCESITHPYCDREKAMFIKGAKWQQERSYSEVFEWLSNMDYLSDKVDIIQKEFEQFKKK